MVDILGIGTTGLTAYRKLLETVGSNIVNANTEGYSRRDVMLAGSGESTMLPTARASTSGSGVVVESVRRGSDSFLQAQAFSANAASKQSQTLADSLNQLEKTIFGSSANVATAVQDFYNRFSDLANSPASTTVRLTLMDAGQRVSEMFRTTSSAITTSLQSVNTAIDTAITQINNIATQLARLNDDIRRSAAGSQQPNDLLDQRDRLLRQLSDLTSFTINEEGSGAIDLYLGDTAAGEKLISKNGARQLGAININGRSELAFDPYLNPSITGQVRSGAVAGLLNFKTEALSVMESVNRLALGFAAAVNEQHMQGIDQDGASGKALFSTDGLVSRSAPSNTGNAIMRLSISASALMTGANYTAKYNSNDGLWTLTSSDGQTVSGAKEIRMDGVTFVFDGAAKANDTFYADPLNGSASSLRFLRKTPSEIAAALPLYVDPATTNKGTGEVAINRRDTPVANNLLPAASVYFGNVGSGSVDFLHEGAAFFIESGTQNASISSLGTLSSLRFSASESEIKALSRNPNATQGALSLNLKINAGTASEKQISLNLFPQGEALKDLADTINAAAEKAELSDSFTAFVLNGRLTISALGDKNISLGKLTGTDSSGSTKNLTAFETGASSAASIRLFTREGRQLSGLAMTAAEASKLITQANGFLPEATYVPPSLTNNYRNLSIASTTSLLSLTQPVQGTAEIDVTAQAEFSKTQNIDGILPGAVYALDISGLPSIRLAGDALGTSDKTEIAEKLEAEANQYATRRSWSGSLVNLSSSTKPTLEFRVAIDGQNHFVTFRRALNEKGLPQNQGTFSVEGPLSLEIGLVQVDPNDPQMGQRVVMSLPPALRSSAPTISINADTATSNALGLSVAPAKTILSAAGNLSESLLSSRVPQIKISGSSFGTKTLNIDAPNGVDGAVGWSVMNGRLVLSSRDPSVRIVTSTAGDQQLAAALGFTGTETPDANGRLTATGDLVGSMLSSTPAQLFMSDGTTLSISGTTGASGIYTWSMNDGQLNLSSTSPNIEISGANGTQRDAAASLGFFGGDLTLTRNGSKLTLESSANDNSRVLADGSKSVSIASNSLQIGPAPEDFIVALSDASTNGIRRISAEIEASGPKTPLLPDLKIKILSASTLEIIDARSGVSLANRKWKADEPVSYLGLTFTMTGAAAIGDVFNVINDPTRTGDNRNALRIAEMATKSIFGPKQGSFQSVYTSVAAEMGSAVSSASLAARSSEKQASDLQSAYEAKTGVNLDREASDLIRYQQSYQAAAQVVSTARELFQTILRIF